MSTPLSTGQVAIGGVHDYAQIRTSAGTPVQFIEQLDAIEREMDFVMGETFAEKAPPARDFYTALTYDRGAPYTPHDIKAFPDGSGLLVAVVPEAGVLEFRKYEIATDDPPAIIDTWTNMKTDFNWAKQMVRIDIACDSSTVFYTDMGRTIFRYDLETRAQLPNYHMLPEGSPYIYAALRVLPESLANQTHLGLPEPGPVVIVSRTASGNGPRNAMTLGSDKSLWVDEINPPAEYHVFKKRLLDGAPILNFVTQANPDLVNDETLSLASLYSPCNDVGNRRIPFGTVIG